MPEKPGRQQAAPLRRPPTRIEYLDHRSEGGWREYRLVVHTPAGPSEVRFRIAAAAFASSRVLLQDGPSICYQQLVLLTAGDAPIPTAVTVGEAELAAYREAHTPPPRGSAAPKFRPKRPPTRPAPVQRQDPKPPVAASARPGTPPTFDEGQRVGDAVHRQTDHEGFGRRPLHRPEHGTRTFLNATLELETRSATGGSPPFAARTVPATTVRAEAASRRRVGHHRPGLGGRAATASRVRR